MRIKATDPEATKVKAVFVDKKLVKFPVEFDTDEGWCIANTPQPPKKSIESERVNPDTDDPTPTGVSDWLEVKLTGEVEVIFHDKEEGQTDEL